MQMLGMKELELDLYFIDKKNEYILLGNSIQIGVLAACSNEPKSSQGSSKEYIKQLLY